jgi:hypothetical protein
VFQIQGFCRACGSGSTDAIKKEKKKEISRFEEHDFKSGGLGAPTGAW